MQPMLSDRELLARLVAFDSTSDKSNLPIVDFICDYLDDPRITLVRQLAPAGDKANVIVRVGGEANPASGGGETSMTVWAVYPVWLELARTRLCEKTGYHYGDIEKLGYRLMVTGLALEYRGPARYGDTVTVTCQIVRLGSRGLRFGYEVSCNDKRLANGTTDHVWLEAERNRPVRIPDILSEPFRRLAGHETAGHGDEYDASDHDYAANWREVKKFEWRVAIL